MISQDNSNDIPHALAPGVQLQSGAFEIQSALGRGGFGITYAARDVRLERDVAIKEFFPEGCARLENSVAPGTLSDEDFSAALKNFEEEARVLARFQHANIVDVYAVFPENNTAYMVMGWVRGASLQKLVETGGALAPEDAIALVGPVCDALETVHGAGLLHADITPANIMKTEAGRVVLLDFGLTRRIASQGYATMRLSNTRLGTAGYAPLEQYGRQSVLGAASDVYALAATLFFLLTGEAPPEATDRATGLALPDLRAINPQISENLAQAISEGLQIEANARPQSAREFCESLQPQNDAPLDISVRAPQPHEQQIDEPDEVDWQRVERYPQTRQTQTREETDPLIDLIFGGLPGQLQVPEPDAPPQRIPQRLPRPFPQRRDTTTGESRGVFVVPGCGGGCGVGCIILLFFAFMILSFFGSLIQSVGYVVGF